MYTKIEDFYCYDHYFGSFFARKERRKIKTIFIQKICKRQDVREFPLVVHATLEIEIHKIEHIIDKAIKSYVNCEM